MKSYYFIISLLILLLSICDCSHDYSAYDYRIFDGTPAEKLAKAVFSGDIPKICHILNKDSTLVNYQESKYGHSVLFNAVIYDNRDVVYTLLEYGANPNIYDKFPGRHQTPVIMASHHSSPSTLKVLLEAGGNPNSYEIVENDRKNVRLYPKSSLFYASQNSIDKVKLLLEYGAIEDLCSPNCEAIKEAIIQENLDIFLLYLTLLEENGKLDEVNKEIDICDWLRGTICDPESTQYIYKMKVKEWLKERGIDYSQTPIHPDVLRRMKNKYPNNWEEIIEKN